MVLYLEEMIMNHKNWGSFSVRRLPSYVIVNLVERIKQLAEQQLGEAIPIDVDDNEV